MVCNRSSRSAARPELVIDVLLCCGPRFGPSAFQSKRTSSDRHLPRRLITLIDMENTKIILPSAPGTPGETGVELEWHCLDKRYEHLLQRTPQLLRRMILSICTYGLLTPITVTSAPAAPNIPLRWIVIDGYLRIQALHQLGKDTIAAQHTPLPADEALMTLYRTHQSRRLRILRGPVPCRAPLAG